VYLKLDTIIHHLRRHLENELYFIHASMIKEHRGRRDLCALYMAYNSIHTGVIILNNLAPLALTACMSFDVIASSKLACNQAAWRRR